MPEQFVFRDLRDLLAKANEEKSGDQLAGSPRARSANAWPRNASSPIFPSRKSSGNL